MCVYDLDIQVNLCVPATDHGTGTVNTRVYPALKPGTPQPAQEETVEVVLPTAVVLPGGAPVDAPAPGVKTRRVAKPLSIRLTRARLSFLSLCSS